MPVVVRHPAPPLDGLITAITYRAGERSLRELGWVIEVKTLAGPFLLGLGGRAG